MKEALQRLSSTAWHELSGAEMNLEEKYFELLKRADAMEQADLITSEEWRRLVQRAGEILCGAFECKDEAGWAGCEKLDAASNLIGSMEYGRK